LLTERVLIEGDSEAKPAFGGSRRVPRVVALSVRRAAALAGLMASLLLALPGSASATAGSDWLPLTGTDIQVGCTWNNGCGGGYHTAAERALDLFVPSGRPVYASGAGTVTQAVGGCGPFSDGCNQFRGNFVTVNHGSHSSRYLHLSGIVVGNGASVAAGQHIGYSGSSGQASPAHLHYDESTDPFNGNGKLDPGILQACHGSTTVSYPGGGGWTGIGAFSTNLRNDGYGCAGSAVSDGSFVLRQGSSEVYRIVGGAPIYVSTWAVYGGAQPTITLPPAQFDALRQYPADGTFVTASTGHVYRIAGGAPIYVSTWGVYGGAQPTTLIDGAAVANAGAGFPWNHLRFYPLDGTMLRAGLTGAHFRVETAAARPVAGPGATAAIVVDPAAIVNAGQAGPWSHLKALPSVAPPTCPVGQTGVLPNCQTPPSPAAPVCPDGQTGTPPDCSATTKGTQAGAPGINTGPVALKAAACLVPRLRGLPLSVARKRLIASGCRVGRVTRIGRSTKGAWVVLRAQFGPGTRRVTGARINLVLRRSAVGGR
jgi:Peptidase family M23